MYGMYLRKSRSDDPNESIDVTLYKHEKILFELADSMKINRKEIMQFKEVVSGENIQNRPQMQKLLQYVMEGVFDGVLVVDSQRLARGDTIDQGTIIRAFSLNETKIITPMKTIDPANEYDQEYFEFDLFMGRREYKMINRRMQRGRHIAVQEGYYLGNVAPYGYKRIKLEKGYSLEINSQEKETFEIIKRMALDGQGPTNIANYLDSVGSKPRKGDAWSKNTINDILTNPVYIGVIKWNTRKTVTTFKNNEIIKTRPRNPDPEYYPGKHPALMTKEEFDTIQNIMKSRSHYDHNIDRSIKNPLAGLVICGDCGHKMNRRNYQNGRQETLLCPASKCKNVSSDLSIVEKRIIETLKIVLREYKTFIGNYDTYSIKKFNSDKKMQLEECDKEIDKLKKQITKACEMLELGAYTVELFKQRKEILDRQIKELEERKEKLKKENESTKLEQYKKAVPKIEKALDLYWDATVVEKNQILKSIIDKCVYKKEKSGRWNPDAINDFKLEIYLKL